MIRLKKATEAQDLGAGGQEADVVVICDPDAARAFEVADGIKDQRTAVFVGDLDDPDDRRAAEEFARELEGGLRPGNSS